MPSSWLLPSISTLLVSFSLPSALISGHDKCSECVPLRHVFPHITQMIICVFMVTYLYLGLHAANAGVCTLSGHTAGTREC
jgi:fumarate reductase subunit D